MMHLLEVGAVVPCAEYTRDGAYMRPLPRHAEHRTSWRITEPMRMTAAHTRPLPRHRGQISFTVPRLRGRVFLTLRDRRE